jgi:aspartyl/asparaginyl beta-hydroxylase (cupin superfamily)
MSQKNLIKILVALEKFQNTEFKSIEDQDAGIQKLMNIKAEIMKNTTTISDYWDCDCKENYIHPASENSCKLCNTFREDQPDSRLVEVINHSIM